MEKTKFITLIKNNCTEVKKTLDIMEAYKNEFTSKVESSHKFTEIDRVILVIEFVKIAEQMDSCEKLIGKTIPEILIADLDIIGDDINICLDMYHKVSDRYESFKKWANKTFYNENYMKSVFNEKT